MSEGKFWKLFIRLFLSFTRAQNPIYRHAVDRKLNPIISWALSEGFSYVEQMLATLNDEFIELCLL